MAPPILDGRRVGSKTASSKTARDARRALPEKGGNPDPVTRSRMGLQRRLQFIGCFLVKLKQLRSGYHLDLIGAPDARIYITSWQSP